MWPQMWHFNCCAARWYVSDTLQFGHSATKPHSGHCNELDQPRRLRNSITCSFFSSRCRIASRSCGEKIPTPFSLRAALRMSITRTIGIWMLSTRSVNESSPYFLRCTLW